jgi:glutathione synthase/RimK-type ligase-like ATP-grasp enzyme
LNKADKVVARAESRVFLSSVLSAIERLNPSALIANRNAAAVFAEEKLVQLMTATSVGLTVPPTLISNNAADIRHFYRQEAGAVIAKQHHPFAWRSAEQTLAVPGTSLVTDQHLQSDFSLEGAPVIYQRLLDITHELRVTVFGRSVFAISQTRVHQDFGGIRDIRWEDPIPRFHKLESDIAEKLLMFMSKMNMNFATFDIAVTKNNEQFFLECNEAGQFLFQEVRVPEINVLDAFCKFLSSGDPNFEYKESPRPIKLSDFENTDIAKDFHRVFTENVRKSTRYSPFELLE